MAVFSCFKELNSSPDETLLDILKGLNNAPCLITSNIWLYLAKCKIGLTFMEWWHARASQWQLFGETYHILCTTGKWHMNHHGRHFSLVVSWNYVKEGYSCGQCHKLKNQSAINAAKKKWQHIKCNPSKSSGRGRRYNIAIVSEMVKSWHPKGLSWCDVVQQMEHLVIWIQHILQKFILMGWMLSNLSSHSDTMPLQWKWRGKFWTICNFIWNTIWILC